MTLASFSRRNLTQINVWGNQTMAKPEYQSVDETGQKQRSNEQTKECRCFFACSSINLSKRRPRF